MARPRGGDQEFGDIKAWEGSQDETAGDADPAPEEPNASAMEPDETETTENPYTGVTKTYRFDGFEREEGHVVKTRYLKTVSGTVERGATIELPEDEAEHNRARGATLVEV